ncbi:GntR family transcriptional regulator [Pseudothermotoga sp.]|nr:GntR family transcriptional regulator [Pseudothermotoga sp.]MCX7812439.1 GntR family transcriptional regulator [Pseudothermotoga sp.]MDW8140107.1 GntR family transcriptional regulator [Pseudothermotoga sp.]
MRRDLGDLKEKIYLDLREKILNEEIKPGEWIVERKLTEIYKVSRTPIREVLRMLMEDGLIELNGKKGYTVKKLSLEDFVEIYTAREAIEGAAARLACRRREPELIEKLNKLKENLKLVDIDKDPAQGVALGRQLHDLLIEYSGNKILKKFYEKLRLLTNMTRNITKRSVEIEKRSRDDHVKIIEAILSNDETRVEELMRKHLRETLKSVVDSYYSLIMKRA